MSSTTEYRQMLLCGLDGSGKTSLIKHYNDELDKFAAKNLEDTRP